MWQRTLSVMGAATLLLAATSVSQAVAAGIVNGGFEIGSFNPPSDPNCAFGYYDGFAGWTVQGHIATPPTSPIPTAFPDCGLPIPGLTDPYYGAQVLTRDDIFVNGSPDSVVPPEGTHFALLSSLPSGYYDENRNVAAEDGPECPTTLRPTLPQPTDIDSDGFFERDVTTLSQQFTVDQVPAAISFDWSYIAGENRNPDENWLHDDFQVTLTPINPPGPPIQILGVTAGNVFNPAYGGSGDYRGTFLFIDPSQLDGNDY
jgi:hypothetical protein